jgi:hypothetical protein
MDKSYLKTVNGLYDLLSDSVKFEFTGPPMVIHYITKDNIGRPDLLAFTYYNNPDLWWAILKANSIRYPFASSLVLRKKKYEQPDEHLITDLYYGRALMIPTISDINIHLNKVRGSDV